MKTRKIITFLIISIYFQTSYSEEFTSADNINKIEFFNSISKLEQINIDDSKWSAKYYSCFDDVNSYNGPIGMLAGNIACPFVAFSDFTKFNLLEMKEDLYTYCFENKLTKKLLEQVNHYISEENTDDLSLDPIVKSKIYIPKILKSNLIKKLPEEKILNYTVERSDYYEVTCPAFEGNTKPIIQLLD